MIVLMSKAAKDTARISNSFAKILWLKLLNYQRCHQNYKNPIKLQRNKYISDGLTVDNHMIPLFTKDILPLLLSQIKNMNFKFKLLFFMQRTQINNAISWKYSWVSKAQK